MSMFHVNLIQFILMVLCRQPNTIGCRNSRKIGTTKVFANVNVANRSITAQGSNQY